MRTLILTFNRTLRGYVEALAHEQAATGAQVELTVDTFAHWALGLLNSPTLAKDSQRRSVVLRLGAKLPIGADFLCDEVDYICGLYLPAARQNYLTAKREGRGSAPRVDKELRQRILDDVITPYETWKKREKLMDWSDLEVALATQKIESPYDIIIVDETQDFSANQIRAVLNQTARESAATFILDAAQRIYARGFSWSDVGIKLTPNNSHRLEVNYRNTKQIAAFAAPLIEGIASNDIDATIPNLAACTRDGQKPVLLVGKFSQQVAHAIAFIRKRVDLANESVAFLHPKGWFDATRTALDNAGLPFVEITKNREWPAGLENIALSTIHSAKGLEFDHVFLLGLNAEVLIHGEEPGDTEADKLRRLLAMGVTRARTTVMIGYKLKDRSDLMDFLATGTFDEIRL